MKSYHLQGTAPYYTNSFLLVTEQNHAVIIDPAASVAEYQTILQKESASLVAIFCTHGHFDHVGSAMALREETGAMLYCNPQDTRGNQMFPLPYADKGYTDGETITIDELSVQVWCTPGHSEGCACLLCQDFFFTGDTLFCGSIGRTDLEGSDPYQMLASLRKLVALALPGQVQVLPGHDRFSTYAQELAHNWHLQNGCQ